MKKNTQPSDNQIAIYQSPDGGVNIEVLYVDENIWLTQKLIAQLFECSIDNISLHLKNIFADRELDPKSVIEEYSTTASDGKKYTTKHYSLEAIVAVGYRVNSERGTQFRQWATGILKNYIHKGYALDSNRFKYGSRFSARYFDELYEEIKDIRTSERMIYQKITDIYATAIDYSPKAFESKQFFATVQNKLHFAITGQTAAEIITDRVSSEKDTMGLTSWRRSPQGKIMPSDVVIAKNYLDKKELTHLNRIGNMYLDYAEMQASRGKAMTMKDWIEKLNAFLKFSEYEILTNAGKISHEVAETLARDEYKKYKKVQDKNYLSDFDREVRRLSKVKGQKSKVQDGYIALITVLVTGAVGVAIATSLLLLGLGSSRTSFSLEQSNQAKALANACSEEALQQIRDSTPFTGTGNLTLGQGTCSYTVTSGGGQNRTITSSGIVGTIVRKVKIIIDKITPNINVTSWQEVADF